MPIEAVALLMQDVPLVCCPKCHAEPFTPFLRGQVQRSRWISRAGWKATLFSKPFDYCAVICADCKNIVDWEHPCDLQALVEKYDRHRAVKEMVSEWKPQRKTEP